MGRVARRLGLFAGVGFVVLIALRLATFELPPLPVPLSGARAEQAQVYAGIYLGIAAFSSISIVKTLIFGVVGAGLGFLFLPRGQLRAGTVLASGGMFALATFLLDGPVTRSIGEVPWLVCVVVIGAFITHLSGRVAFHAASRSTLA